MDHYPYTIGTTIEKIIFIQNNIQTVIDKFSRSQILVTSLIHVKIGNYKNYKSLYSLLH